MKLRPLCCTYISGSSRGRVFGALPPFAFTLLIATPLLAGAMAQAADTKKTVELSLHVEKKTVSLQVSAPLDAILTQNRRPTKEPEQAALQKALAALKSDALVFTFPAAAECSIHFSKLNTEMSEHTLKAEDSQHAQLQAAGTGGKVVAHYEGSCDKPTQFLSFETSLFAILQDAQQISLRGQRDGKRVSQDLEVPKPRGPVTFYLEGQGPMPNKAK